MNLFLKKVIVFLILTLLFSLVISLKTKSKIHGLNTSQQIEFQFNQIQSENYKTVILGNSRLYRGINPKNFKLPTFNFTHDNDNFNVIYYKLLCVLKYQKDVETIILGIDYFQFSFLSDTRNHTYNKFLDKKYSNDFSVFSNLKSKIKFLFVNPESFIKTNYNTLNEWGYYEISPDKSYDPKKPHGISRISDRIDIQEKYFKKILKLISSKNIRLILIMPPTQKEEINFYSNEEIYEFNSFINKEVKEFNHIYLNLSLLEGFTKKDFYDLTHLNNLGTDKFSLIIEKKIDSIITLNHNP
jgi:hypothetical protein